MPSSSNDQRKPPTEFMDCPQWTTFARFQEFIFNNQTFCLLKVCELLPTTTIKNTCFVINWVEVQSLLASNKYWINIVMKSLLVMICLKIVLEFETNPMKGSTITFFINSSFVTRFRNAYKVFFIKSRMCCIALWNSRFGTSQHSNTSQCCTYWYYKMLFWTSFLWAQKGLWGSTTFTFFATLLLITLKWLSLFQLFPMKLTMLPTSKCKHKYTLHISYP